MLVKLQSGIGQKRVNVWNLTYLNTGRLKVTGLVEWA